MKMEMELDLRLGIGDAHSTQKQFTQLITRVDEPPVIQLDLLPLIKPVQRRHSPPPQQFRLPCKSYVAARRGEDEALVSSSTYKKFPRVVKSEKDLLENNLSIKVKTEQRGVSCRRACDKGEDDDDDDDDVWGKKKLRLSKEQSAFLEECFKKHHTVTPKQKVVLAKQLSLRPRQVEVWFQNRRARTKLKQRRVDCEYMKRYYTTLREENKRLRKELRQQQLLLLVKRSTSDLNNNNTTYNLTATVSCPVCGSSIR